MGFLVSVISVREVDAAVLPSPEFRTFNLSSPDLSLRPSDELMDKMLQQISDRDERFSDLERFRSFDYLVFVEYQNSSRDVVVGYDFFFADTISYISRNYIVYNNNTDLLEYDSLVSRSDIRNFLFGTDTFSSRTLGIFGYRFNASGDFVSPHYVDMVQSDTYYIPYSGYTAGRTFNLIYSNANNLNFQYLLPAFTNNDMPGSENGGSDSGFWKTLLAWLSDFWDNLVNFFAPIVDFFVNLFQNVWDLIVYIIGLLIPVTSEAWIDLFNDIQVKFKAIFGVFYYAVEYLLAILGRILTGGSGSSVFHFSGNFFGADGFTLDFGILERYNSSVWNTIILFIRGVFVLTIWPSIIGFFTDIIFRDFTFVFKKRGDDA